MSVSIMIVLICMFTGIRDIASLLGLFASNTAMILFGLKLVEVRAVSAGRCAVR